MRIPLLPKALIKCLMQAAVRYGHYAIWTETVQAITIQPNNTKNATVCAGAMSPRAHSTKLTETESAKH